MEQTKSGTATTQTAEFQVLNLEGGRKAAMLAPDLNDGQYLCIISGNLLKRLTDLLPKVSLSEIKAQFIEDIETTHSMNHFIEVIASELDFHNSVRRVNKFFGTKEMTVVEHQPEAVAVAKGPVKS